jgi:hypothetical protein
VEEVVDFCQKLVVKIFVEPQSFASRKKDATQIIMIIMICTDKIILIHNHHKYLRCLIFAEGELCVSPCSLCLSG